MAGDFSRSTVNRIKHYAGVLMQQGRVLVDADWNEQLALQLHRTWTETRDVIGRCGTPQSGAGFAISSLENGADLLIHPGRYYVNGLLCDLDPQAVPAWLPSQLSPPSPPPGSRPIYRIPRGQSFTGALRVMEMNRAQSARPEMLIESSSGAICIPSKIVDGRELAAGDWVEFAASGGGSVTARVNQVADPTASGDPNFIAPSYCLVTLDRSFSSVANAGQLSLRRVVTFTTQPFLLNQWDQAFETSSPSGPAGLYLPDGEYLVVLEAWQREINALEDPHIREVALGGPDTCERLQTVWQVHVFPWSGESSPPASPLASPLSSPPSSPLASPPSPPDCCSDFSSFDGYKASTRTTGLMNAQAPAPGNKVPACQLPPSAGYLGLANQLYRVEIFQPGEFNGTASFVWSRDNAMVETPIVCVDAGGNVYVSSLGTDDLHSFGLNDWVEIVDDDSDLQGQPRFLAQISQPPGSAAQPPCGSPGTQAYCLNLQPGAPARFQNKTNLRLRRWDMTDGQVALNASLDPIGIPIAPGWITLENNIQVNFSDGYYATRSYWQIPARTATGDIEWPPFDDPNGNPVPQPPLGPEHFFCRLALLTVTGGDIQPFDCRCTFPSLNSICADIQQALEERDALHRLRNRTLHGAGVVCGLAVTCPGAGQSSTSVQIGGGYAIDPDGYDLVLGSATNVDLASLVDLSPPQDSVPDGDYELLLERAGDPARACQKSDPSSPPSEPCCSQTAQGSHPPELPVNFRLIPCATELLGEEILDGTLLQDFLTRCVGPFSTAFKAAYLQKHIPGSQQITEGQALLSALTNLVIEYAQPAQNRDVYISADEAQRLSTFYDFVRGQINDCTFCALQAGLPSFPDYPLSAPIDTYYGKGLKTRMRVGPNGRLAYAFGSGPDLHVYNLATGRLAAVITLPIPGDASGWTLQDVAFSHNGAECFVIATGMNTKTSAGDSLFAAGRVAGTTVTWTAQGSAGPHPYISLASIPTQPEVAYAAAQGAGIYVISLAGGIKETQMAQFNAIGHLVHNGEFLYATASTVNANGGTAYQVQRYAAQPTGAAIAQQPEMVFPINGLTVDLTDDLAVGSFANAPGSQIAEAVFVSGYSSASATKHLVLFNASNKGEPAGEVDLHEKTTIRLAVHPYAGKLSVSYEASSRLATVAGNADGLALSRYAPVELHPTALAFGVAQEHFSVYTLNSTANTLSAMSADMPAFDAYSALEQYRTQALGAFLSLAEAYLQSLKDCFCKLLLPACPGQAPEDKGVALACITVQDNTVQKICNLEKRKIVKSFPTVGYWLSLIPVIPLVKALVEKFCCLTLSNLFNKPVVSGPATNRVSAASSFLPALNFASVSGENLRYALSQASKINFSSLPATLLPKAVPISRLTLDAIVSPFRQPPPAAVPVSIDKINGMSLDQAKATLQAANVQVATTEAYDPATFTQNLGSYLAAPASVPSGSSVTLVVDSNNIVRYYVPTAPAVQQLQARVAAFETGGTPALQHLQSLQNTVSGLQTQIANLQATHATELASRDQQIAQLTTTTQELQAKLIAVDSLSNQIKTLEGRLPPAHP